VHVLARGQENESDNVLNGQMIFYGDSIIKYHRGLGYKKTIWQITAFELIFFILKPEQTHAKSLALGVARLMKTCPDAFA